MHLKQTLFQNPLETKTEYSITTNRALLKIDGVLIIKKKTISVLLPE